MKVKLLNIALVAHDSRKKELLEWVDYNKEILINHHLICTGTTGKLISETLNDNYPMISCFKSGPLGGDQQIGAKIADGDIDILIFFCDNLISQGHQTDISALSRLASLYNIGFASNRTTADLIITSSLFTNGDYKPIKPNFDSYLNRTI